MHLRSDKKDIMIYDKTDEVIKKTSMQGRNVIFDYVNLLH